MGALAPKAGQRCSMLTLSELTKTYGTTQVLDHLNAQLPGGSLTALVGPSGVGKTSLLRLIAGLERPDHGVIAWADHVWCDADRSTPAWRRSVSMVFQDLALWPHLTVDAHLDFVLKGQRDLSRADRRRRSSELLKPLGLEALASRYPAELSGGQQQRVALARALARNAALLLLDEPFSQLDADARADAWQLVLEERAARHLTVIVATHALAALAGDVDQVWSLEGVRRFSIQAATRDSAQSDTRCNVVPLTRGSLKLP